MTIPSVSIIIVNWNSAQDTLECVDSCLKMNYKNFSIQIIDNGSTDNSIELLNRYMVKKNDSRLIIKKSNDNLGFAGGCNLGIREAVGEGFDYIWLLNNDTIVHQNALSELIDGIITNPRAGVVGSKIYYYDPNSTENIIWFIGGRVDLVSGNTEHVAADSIDNGNYNSIQPVDYITGCSMLVSVKAIKNTGLMDEDFFLYWEETDWCMKFREKGYDLLFIPKSIIWHKVSKSTGLDSPLMRYYMIRNGLLFAKRYARYSWGLKAIMELKNVVIRDLIHFRWKHVRYSLKGYSDFMRGRLGKL